MKPSIYDLAKRDFMRAHGWEYDHNYGSQKWVHGWQAGYAAGKRAAQRDARRKRK